MSPSRATTTTALLVAVSVSVSVSASAQSYSDEGAGRWEASPPPFRSGELYMPPDTPDQQALDQAMASSGVWIDTPEFGRVWRPASTVVGNDFAPYSTGGRWIRENEHWVFSTPNWRWGWATFRFGRWHQHPRHGWVWMAPRPDVRRWPPSWILRPRWSVSVPLPVHVPSRVFAREVFRAPEPAGRRSGFRGPGHRHHWRGRH